MILVVRDVEKIYANCNSRPIALGDNRRSWRFRNRVGLTGGALELFDGPSDDFFSDFQLSRNAQSYP